MCNTAELNDTEMEGLEVKICESMACEAIWSYGGVGVH